MAPRLEKPADTRQQDAGYNRLCIRCRRGCKQPEFTVISACPRYYPTHTRQNRPQKWKQAELFSDA